MMSIESLREKVKKAVTNSKTDTDNCIVDRKLKSSQIERMEKTDKLRTHNCHWCGYWALTERVLLSHEGVKHREQKMQQLRNRLSYINNRDERVQKRKTYKRQPWEKRKDNPKNKVEK